MATEVKIGSIEVVGLIVGIVQTVKKLVAGEGEGELSNRETIAVAMGVGAVLFTAAELINGGYLSEDAADVVTMVVRIVSYLTAVPGFFSVAKDEVITRIADGE